MIVREGCRNRCCSNPHNPWITLRCPIWRRRNVGLLTENKRNVCSWSPQTQDSGHVGPQYKDNYDKAKIDQVDHAVALRGSGWGSGTFHYLA